jgi:allantoicase
MKVLLSAYACEPGRGTELGVGWNTVREVARVLR